MVILNYGVEESVMLGGWEYAETKISIVHFQ